jgi:hypothetical protein
MSADSASEVSGPVATMTGDPSGAGMRVTSSRTTVMSGCEVSASVTRRRETIAVDGQRRARRHARASAARITSEPSRRISSLSRPTALSSLSPRNELLQTSSASPSVLCTAVGRTGRISWT